MSENGILTLESSPKDEIIDVGSSLLTLTRNKIPEKSKTSYENCYNHFKLWCRRKNAKVVTESVLLLYLKEKSKILKSSSLWSTYSKLKTMLHTKEGLDIKNYKKVVSFLGEKSLILTREDIKKFLEEADDEMCLTWKVVLIMGITGGLKCIEIARITIDDIEDRGHALIVTIPDKNNTNNRIFTITNQDYIRIYRKYLSLRPKNVKSRQLFLKDDSGAYFTHGGQQTIGKVPSSIARYLRLPNVNRYTGHCFRLSSVALRRNNDSFKMDLERRGEVDGFKHIEIANNLLYNCRLCLKLPENAPFGLVSTINSDYIQLVLPEIDLTRTESPRICPDCFKNLENAYNFKTKCLESETQIRIINEGNNANKIEEEIEEVKVEVGDYEISSPSNSSNNENDTIHTKIEHKIQPKFEMVTIENNENEKEEEVILDTIRSETHDTIYYEHSYATDQHLLPKKSRERYEKAYKNYDGWCKKKNIDSSEIKESVILSYFEEQAKCFKPTSLWSIYSMLKSTILLKHNENIGTYSKLIEFLKQKSLEFVPKRTKVFSQHEVDKFLLEAPDEEYLLMKAVLIVGLAGSCGSDELTKLTLDSIDDEIDDIIQIKLPGTTMYKPRTIVVIEGDNGVNVNLLKKYLALRQTYNTRDRCLFVAYRAWKSVAQPLGSRGFAKIPAQIATYLGLPEPELYTGHCLRRTSATSLVVSGDVSCCSTTSKRGGENRSVSLEEMHSVNIRNLKESLENKINSNFKKVISMPSHTEHQENLQDYEVKMEIEEYFVS